MKNPPIFFRSRSTAVMLTIMLAALARPAHAQTTQTPTPTATNTSAPDLIFADGFEAGDLSAWTTSTTDGGDLSVSPAAALAGGNGLQAVINDNVAIFLTDDRPSGETRYRARFYFDPNSIPMAGGNAHYIFYGVSATSTVALRVEFRFSSGGYQLRAALRKDGSSWSNSNWMPLSDIQHFVELD